MIIKKSRKHLKTPILFLVFNRPHLTAQSFEAIRKAKPLKLYISCDGPRLNKVGEKKLVNKVRNIVKKVDWPCQVKKLYQSKNLGCSYGVSTALNWFFEHEKQGIILEDDNLPHKDFFFFCETLLNRYKNNKKISTISGDNFQNGIRRGKASYYFSKYFHGWGWATWRREWKFYDKKIRFFPKWIDSIDWKNKFPDKVERKYWYKIFKMMHETDFDSMAYPFQASIMYRNGLNIVPNVNLVSNIGYGEDATHTKKKNDQESNIPTKSIHKLIHPKKILINHHADNYDFDWTFGGRNLRFPRNLLILPKKIFYLILRKINLLN